MASICQYEPPGQVDRRGLSGRISHAKPMHVLTLTPFFPMAADDAAGCFVAEPLAFLHEFEIKNSVIAVRPYHRGGRRMENSAVHSATWMRYAAPPGMMGLPVSGRTLYLGIRKSVRRLHAMQPLDLIHAHAALPCGSAAALLARDLGIPFAVTVHGRDVFSSRNAGLVGRWCERVCKEVYSSAARVICISGKVQEELLSRVHCRSAVVHNGVDTEMFSPRMSSETSPVVLSVGNLIPTKGHERLLRAVAAVIGRHPCVRCQIIGIGPERQRLAGVAEQLGISHRVEFLGRQSRAAVARAMQSCSVFVLPSTYEGLGCVYLEAMASGKPAIGCTGQGIAEIIQSEQTGWLIKPGDTAGLTNALDHLLSDPALRNRIGMKARQAILERFTLRQQAERLAQIYQECVQ